MDADDQAGCGLAHGQVAPDGRFARACLCLRVASGDAARAVPHAIAISATQRALC
jgi:hypothetical protein